MGPFIKDVINRGGGDLPKDSLDKLIFCKNWWRWGGEFSKNWWRLLWMAQINNHHARGILCFIKQIMKLNNKLLMNSLFFTSQQFLRKVSKLYESSIWLQKDLRSSKVAPKFAKLFEFQKHHTLFQWKFDQSPLLGIVLLLGWKIKAYFYWPASKALVEKIAVV